MNREYVGKAEGKQWEALCKPDGQIPASYPRGTFVACFRLLTGHDFPRKTPVSDRRIPARCSGSSNLMSSL
ncbi:hypothetical protein O3M35_006506 [Rhynocoris fuscipes]|uniref:Uncharacterized protein n=1 Tax=Rhynocoris fuscipes TaxID=488301 RepID=A0AAW1DGG2_9HEMI